jgi:hypothetical protein
MKAYYKVHSKNSWNLNKLCRRKSHIDSRIRNCVEHIKANKKLKLFNTSDRFVINMKQILIDIL